MSELFGYSLYPQNKEVWLVNDYDVKLVPASTRSMHEKRYVLLVMNEKHCSGSNIVYNIVPLTASAKRYDIFTFPLGSDYKEIAQGADLKSTSSAIINHFQPIHRDKLHEKQAILNDSTYYAIVNLIREELIGCSPEYDLDVT